MSILMKLFFTFILLTHLVLASNFDKTLVLSQEIDEDAVINEFDEESPALRGNGRFLGSKKKWNTLKLTCNKYPRICGAKGSPGAYCCKKKCVNLLMDRQNCGKCGKKCKYNEMCCRGKCVNTAFNGRHCGGCNNRCNRGELCLFGLCNYA